jgi:hypothetical protein
MHDFNFNFVKKISQLNAVIMTLNDIMKKKKKNPYFGLIKIDTHYLFSLKHNKFIKIMTKSVQPLKFTGFFFFT